MRDNSRKRLVIARTPEEKTFWHGHIERMYKANAWDAYARKRDFSKVSHDWKMARFRLRELERLYLARHKGGCLPDDEAGREYLEIAARHIAHLRGEVEQHIVSWCETWAPWLATDDAKQLARRIAAKPRRWKADPLAAELNLSMAERTELGILTIGAVDVNKRQRTALRKENRKKNEHERRRRAAAAEGRILRARPGRPRNTTNPWGTEGISRRTWYRRRQKAEQQSISNATDVSVSVEPGSVHGSEDSSPDQHDDMKAAA